VIFLVHNFEIRYMTIAIPNAYDEIIDFIAAGLTPTSLIAFQPSEAANERVAELIFREKIWRY
jgi:hypothetical protein